MYRGKTPEVQTANIPLSDCETNVQTGEMNLIWSRTMSRKLWIFICIPWPTQCIKNQENVSFSLSANLMILAILTTLTSLLLLFLAIVATLTILAILAILVI